MQYIFSFNEGSASQNDLLGGKGANLAEMTRLGFPVPPGFTISTKTCLEYFEKENEFPETLPEELEKAISELEEKTGKKFADPEDPLLVSVRSGAKISMPGMMDTVLNLGLNDEVTQILASITKDERFAYDSYRRFLQMFGNVVLGIKHNKFESIIIAKKNEKGVNEDNELQGEDWKEVIHSFKEIIQIETGKDFPQNPHEQLNRSIKAVFESWHAPRAKKYREINKISDDLGTAVNIQMMVFGNLSDTSGTGVCFTRNPVNGKKELFGDFLINAQGEDVVAGIRTPKEIVELELEMPEMYIQLKDLSEKLETHFREMQDIEFTIENKIFYLLQSRNGKRTAKSAVKIAYDMVQEKLITKPEAILRIDADSLNQLLHPTLDESDKKNIIAKGVPASPGAACGKVVFTAEDAVKFHKKDEKIILVRHETSPEDIEGMHVSEGILTACGGKASHTAVVARGMGTPCITGANEIIVNSKEKKLSIKELIITEGEIITLDGGTGEIILGTCKTIEPKIADEFEELLTWADEVKKMKIRTNADTPQDVKKAREFGVEGIGLCRTEHMFFEKDRIKTVREMILAETTLQREQALEKLLPHQQEDFEAIFIAMDNLPTTIRFLDPPLHEFVPHRNSDIESFANNFNLTFEQAKDRIKSLEEVNPMLGHRGCRLLITYPEILKMQVKAILQAAINVKKRGITVLPELMIPLVCKNEEFKFLKNILLETAKKVFEEQKEEIEYQIGTMIELPRACLTAHHIAKEADFFSFGTNDLTQMTFGFSRDDIAKFFPAYFELGILKQDPFETIDQNGVGELIKLAVKQSKDIKPTIKISICGEHGGDPTSIEFFHKNKFDIVSCSPFRVPIARLSAAQAALRDEE